MRLPGTALLFFTLLKPAFSRALDFKDAPAPLKADACPKLDFFSTSKSRNAESLIRSSNPDLKSPNFGGKYLLLKVPYAMETDWLIADCESGKFLKAEFEGEAEFHPDSFLVKTKTPKEEALLRFTGSQFIRQEPDVKAAPSPGPDRNPLLARYEEAFRLYPADQASDSTPQAPCKPFALDSNSRTQGEKSRILKNYPDPSQPNFNHAFRVVKLELIFETLWMIAECGGKGAFFPDFISGDTLTFQKESRLAVLTSSGKAPELYTWDRNAWIRHPDPSLTHPSAVENTLQGADARLMISILPNPGQANRIGFKTLRCTKDGADCTLEQTDGKSVKILRNAGAGLESLLSSYGSRTSGGEFEISEGECERARERCVIHTK